MTPDVPVTDALLHALPKTDLHCHLDGSLRLRTMLELAEEQKIRLPADSEEGLARFFSLTSVLLDERQRRLVAAAMVEVLGRGGQARVVVVPVQARALDVVVERGRAEVVDVHRRGVAAHSVRLERLARHGVGEKRDVEPSAG